MENKVALIVLSCDKYADMWDIFFGYFFKNWPDCPFKVYLVANKMSYAHSRVTTLQSGEDLDWSSSLRKCISQITEECLFFIYEDALISKKVNTSEISNYYKIFIDQSLNYLRLRPSPRPDIKISKNIGVIERESVYRTTLFLSFWKKPFFLDMLRDGESAWEFEVNGTVRSKNYDGFCATYKDVFVYTHCIIRGKWINSSYNKVINEGYSLKFERDMLYRSTSHEKIMDIYNYLKFKMIDMIPGSKREKVIYRLGVLKCKLLKLAKI